MNLRHAILILVVLAFGATPKSWCDDAVAVAVTPLQNAGPEAREGELGEALASLLVQSFSTSHKVILVERVDLEKILQEQTLAARVKALQGARALCTGSFAINGKNLALTIRIIDLADSQVICSAAASGRVAQLEDTLSQVTSQLLKGLTPADSIPAKNQADEKLLRANLSYAQGLGEFWLGSYPAAAACFTRCLSTAEQHNAARFWLAQSYHKMNLHLSAKLELYRFQTGPSEAKWAVQAKQLDQTCTAKLTADELQDFERIVAAE